MANILPVLCRNHFSRFVHISGRRHYSRIRIVSNLGTLIKNDKKFLIQRPLVSIVLRTYCEEKKKIDECIPSSSPQKPTLFQRFKSMYKDYWYVLIPVHVVTSIGWFGGFYYMAKSGVDIIGLLEAMNVNDKIIDSMRDSRMGYFAISYACYKIATPARYTVTLGGTTISINYLKKWGYIKPVPSAEKLKEMYKMKKDNFDKTMKEKKQDLIAKKEEFKHKIDDRLEQGIHKIEELKEKTDKMKKKAENILKEKK